MLAKVFIAQGQLALVNGDPDKAAAYVQEAAGVIEPKWKIQPNEDLRLRKAQILTLQGESAMKDADSVRAKAALQAAVDLLADNPGGELPFTRLGDLVHALDLLGLKDQAEPHRKRMLQSGYVSFKPFPESSR